MENKIIMGWSQCEIEIGRTGANDPMAVTLVSSGTIKDKSSTLETSDGDSLEAKKTGGKLVAKETQEGGFVLKTRIIEPTAEFEALIGVAEEEVDGEANVKTHIVDGDWSVKLTPKNVGARGIKAPLTQITYKPGWSEEEGNFADLEFFKAHRVIGTASSRSKEMLQHLYSHPIAGKQVLLSVLHLLVQHRVQPSTTRRTAVCLQRLPLSTTLPFLCLPQKPSRLLRSRAA